MESEKDKLLCEEGEIDEESQNGNHQTGKEGEGNSSHNIRGLYSLSNMYVN